MEQDKNVKWMNDTIHMQNEYKEFLEIKKKIHPARASLRISLIYLVVGGLWILLSDRILDFLVNSEKVYRNIQLYKGWAYVFLTGLLFFFIIKRTLGLYKRAVFEVVSSYEEISAAYEELMAMAEELDDQNERLDKQKMALAISEQRYALVVEGSSDGIWDWDLKTNNYFVSDKTKRLYGFENMLDSLSIFDWETLYYPGDWERTKQYIEEYLQGRYGIFECMYRLRRPGGEYRWILSRGKGVWDKDGTPIRIAGSHTDITEKKELEDKLENFAYYDTLTGLPNQNLFEKKVAGLIDLNKEIAIVNIDLDDIKQINDLFGRESGDQYIRHIGKVLKNQTNSSDLVAHLNGDQFVMAYSEEVEIESVLRRLEKLLIEIRRPWQQGSEYIKGSASIGVSFFPKNGNTYSELLQKAEIAMYHKKESGKNGIVFFEEYMYQDVLDVIKMNAQLQKAVDNEEFMLYYQPQIDLKTEEMVGVEALIRWNHPVNGFIPPMEFIPLSEKTGHIIPISIWVIRKAILQMREWQAKGYVPVKVAINMSGHVITNEKYVDQLIQIMEESHVVPGEIEIEVTETALMVELEQAKLNLARLRAFGVTVAMDDFGTGYSSLTYLHTLPFDILKMDREFIMNIKTEDEENFIYRTLIELAHNMELHIVAEGIETKEQRDFLLRNHCDYGQGFYYSKPLPPQEMEQYLKQQC